MLLAIALSQKRAIAQNLSHSQPAIGSTCRMKQLLASDNFHDRPHPI